LRNLEDSFDISDQATFSDMPEKYIEVIALEDVKILFHQAQKLFSEKRYAESILKIESILAWDGR